MLFSSEPNYCAEIYSCAILLVYFKQHSYKVVGSVRLEVFLDQSRFTVSYGVRQGHLLYSALVSCVLCTGVCACLHSYLSNVDFFFKTSSCQCIFPYLIKVGASFSLAFASCYAQTESSFHTFLEVLQVSMCGVSKWTE